MYFSSVNFSFCDFFFLVGSHGFRGLFGAFCVACSVRTKLHGIGGPSRFWEKSMKKIMNLLLVGVFLSQEKKREFYAISQNLQ